MSNCCVVSNVTKREGHLVCALCGSSMQEEYKGNSDAWRRSEAQAAILTRNRTEVRRRKGHVPRSVYVPVRNGIQDELW